MSLLYFYCYVNFTTKHYIVCVAIARDPYSSLRTSLKTLLIKKLAIFVALSLLASAGNSISSFFTAVYFSQFNQV